MTLTPLDRPAAVHDSQLNKSGGGRTQDARTGAPLPASAPPASASPRGASAGPSTPARPSQDPRAGVDPRTSAAALDLALSAAADPDPAGDALEGARRVPAGSTPGTAGIPGERTRERTSGNRPGRGVEGPLRPGQDTRSWTLELPPGMKVLSLNGRGHWSERNKISQDWKTAAWALARQAKIPPLGRVSVVAEYRPPDRRRRDGDNFMPTVKACIDGFVDAGVIEDDASPQYVADITSRIGDPVLHGQLVLTITEVAGLTGIRGAGQ